MNQRRDAHGCPLKALWGPLCVSGGGGALGSPPENPLEASSCGISWVPTGMPRGRLPAIWVPATLPGAEGSSGFNCYGASVIFLYKQLGVSLLLSMGSTSLFCDTRNCAQSHCQGLMATPRQRLLRITPRQPHIVNIIVAEVNRSGCWHRVMRRSIFGYGPSGLGGVRCVGHKHNPEL